MLNQNVSFDEVYDKFALRIVYKANHDENFWLGKYSIVTDHYPSPSRLRLDILPKSTGYEACIL
jgi:GTP pyrophosphokinase